jgi:hypothetical protein
MSTFRVKKSSDVIPVGTTRVEVANKEIGRLPSLPVGITVLDCTRCTSLHELPPLPTSLIVLICFGCTSLRELPPLPIGLTVLYCSHCTSLRELPPLPESLTELYCHCTSLRELPPLPESLTRLFCFECTSLLYLPTISKDCKYYGPFLSTKEEYFEESNMGKNQELVASRGDELLYRIIGKDITDVVKGYLS